MLSKTHAKTPASVLLAICLAAVFALGSFAAPEPANPAADEIAQVTSGVLSGKGQITINGNAAQAGATILSGSTIGTGSDGYAVIDLGALGRVELRPNTVIELTFTADGIHIKSPCNVKVAVTRGQVAVIAPNAETINSGEDKRYEGGAEFNAAIGTDVILDCGSGAGVALAGATAGTAAGGGVIGPGLTGVLILAGVGGAVAAGVAVGGQEPPAQVSGIVP
ncbi:MAG TPA: hypothetical protein VJH03_07525 [Blastocatellia bacterium]|nr:hypothetical protein [Blastocatellia bacterium]